MVDGGEFEKLRQIVLFLLGVLDIGIAK